MAVVGPRGAAHAWEAVKRTSERGKGEMFPKRKKTGKVEGEKKRKR